MDEDTTRSGLALRRKAEGNLQNGVLAREPSAQDLSALTTKKLLHELQVHQIELEMQNEELLRAHAELDTAKARYFDLYDLAPVGYCTLNEQGLILEANLAAAALLGVARSGLAAKPLHRFLAPTSQDRYYLGRKALMASGTAQDFELQVAVQSCDPHTPAPWVHMHMSALPVSNDATALRVVFHDISDRKRLESEAHAKSLELERAWQLADHANRAKSDFLSSMTHELRSPLNAILGFAQLLNMGATPPTSLQKSNIDQIVQAGWYLLDLVNAVLDLSLVESGKLSVVLAPVPLSEVLQDCQTMLEPLAQKKGIGVHYNMPPQSWALMADKTRLKQICINLLSNAIQYNRPQGSIDITCTLQAQDRVRVTVVDTGEGLTADKLAQLFQPFNRLGRESGDQQGTGIGLAISKHLVELMGGSLGAQSTLGTGSEFWFELPAAPHMSPTPSAHG